MSGLAGLRRLLFGTARGTEVSLLPQVGPRHLLRAIRYEEEAEPAFGVRSFRQVTFEIELVDGAPLPEKGDRILHEKTEWRVTEVRVEDGRVLVGVERHG